MDEPYISILICTYNRAKLIQRAINSVLSQTFQNFELIIIDDCSSDNTADIVASFNDSRIRYLRNQVNMGAKFGDRTHVRRFVYELMRGQYFVYLCDDDYWINNDLLEKQLEAFQGYDNVSMVIGGQLSYFIPAGCDLCLVKAEKVKNIGLSVNGCYSWHDNVLSYIAPNGKIIKNIPFNEPFLSAILEQFNTSKTFAVQNNIKKYFLKNEDIQRIVISVDSTLQTLHSDLPPVKEIPCISYRCLHKVPIPRTVFIKDLYPKKYMRSKEFLNYFSSDPATRNMIVGATLYSKQHFVAAGAMKSETGSRWQAGYEFLMAPACIGNVIYLDEPCIVVEVRHSNASFQGTQHAHYMDCIDSIHFAFQTPIQQCHSTIKKRMLKTYERKVIRNITRAFLSNTLEIKLKGLLTVCNNENLKEPVTPSIALQIYRTKNIRLQYKDLKLICMLKLPLFLIKRLKNRKALFYPKIMRIISILERLRSQPLTALKQKFGLR